MVLLAVKVPLSAVDAKAIVGGCPTWTSGAHPRSRHPENGGVTMMSQAQNTHGLMLAISTHCRGCVFRI
jgi:hypothetical protein